MNKRGMDFNVIIGLVFAVLIIILGFYSITTTFNPLKNIISPTNVDSLKEECANACSFEQKFNYCSLERTLRVNEDKFSVKASCAVLANVPDFAEYNFAECSNVVCDETPCESISIDNKKGVATDIGAEGKYDVSAFANNLEEGQICIIN